MPASDKFGDTSAKQKRNRQVGCELLIEEHDEEFEESRRESNALETSRE